MRLYESLGTFIVIASKELVQKFEIYRNTYVSQSLLERSTKYPILLF